MCIFGTSNDQQLEFWALILLMPLLAAMPALNVALWRSLCLCQFVTLHERSAVSVRLAMALMLCGHLVIVEEAHGLDDCFGEVV
jgi:hypothetical protein